MTKLIEVREIYDICRISAFYQNHVSGRIQRRMDYFLISNVLQETVIKADVLPSFCSDHRAIIFTTSFESNNKRRKGLLKLNKSLLSKDKYINNSRNHISESLSILDQNGIRDDQIRWEFKKFEIRQFSISFSKNFSKSLNAEREILEKELKDFEKSGSSYFDN